MQQRQSIADGLARIMNDLGLERREKVETINDMIENALKQAQDGVSTEDGRDGQPPDRGDLGAVSVDLLEENAAVNSARPKMPGYC